MIESPPREITPFVRRRAWAEPRVRGWWLLAIVLAVLGVYLGVTQYFDWSRLNRAISSGVTVPATVLAVEGDGRKGKSVSAGAPVVITYDYQGKTYQKEGTLSGMTGSARVGDAVPLHIDPADPDNWTARNIVPALGVAMTGTILVLPVAAIALLLALLARSTVLKTYEHGQAVEAIVIGNKQTPLAPRSRAITASIASGGRTFEVVVPPALAGLAEGESIKLILPTKPGRPLAAAWYEERTDEF